MAEVALHLGFPWASCVHLKLDPDGCPASKTERNPHFREVVRRGGGAGEARQEHALDARWLLLQDLLS